MPTTLYLFKGVIIIGEHDTKAGLRCFELEDYNSEIGYPIILN
tara:strand:+ start:427 stop:555 length:129 start_codon:yes stop_codon:yes gene_type:complete